MTAPWAAVGERGSPLGLRLTAWVAGRVGPRLGAWLTLPVVTYFFLTDAAGRRASRRYLARVAAAPGGREAVGAAPGVRHCFRHYREFGLQVLDRLRLARGGADIELALHGRQHIDRLVAARRGALVLGAHLGSFEALRAAAARAGIAVTVVMNRRLSPRISAVLRRAAPGPDARVIDLDPAVPEAVLRLKACVDRGEFVAILGDRLATAPRARRHTAPFLGAPAPFPAGPFALAGALGCPVLLMVALRRDHARYEVFTDLLADGEPAPRGARGARGEALAAAYAERLEAHCLRAPYQWFNFYDFWGDPSPEAA
jgi:predicted LPLAT superfamily acyltransferase